MTIKMKCFMMWETNQSTKLHSIYFGHYSAEEHNLLFLKHRMQISKCLYRMCKSGYSSGFSTMICIWGRIHQEKVVQLGENSYLRISKIHNVLASIYSNFWNSDIHRRFLIQIQYNFELWTNLWSYNPLYKMFLCK